MSRRIRVTISTLCMLLVSPISLAGPRPHEHDGFFLRMCVGFGFGHSSVVDGKEDENTVHGGSNAGEIAIGAMVSENFAVHADMFHVVLIEPESYINGKSAGTIPGRYMAGGLGAGITYYVMPTNLYISASLDFVVLKADLGIVRVESDTGMGIDFLIGKEWWVSDNWGIGIAGQFVYTLVPSDYNTTHHSLGGAVLFTATYN